MGSIIVRNIDDALKARLRVRAAEKGHSMEEEVRTILQRELPPPAPPENLADLAKRLFGKEWGVDLEIDPREPLRDPPDFSE